MHELSDVFKLSVRSHGRVFEAINALVSRYRTTGAVTFRGNKLTREALVNAVILHLESLSEPERIAALRAGMARLEEALEGRPLPDPAADRLPPPLVLGEEIGPQTEPGSSGSPRRPGRKRAEGA